MERYLPDMYKKNIFDVDYQKLSKMGINCLLFDLDNTIATIKEKKPSEETKNLFTKLKLMGFKLIIFSNSPRCRVKLFEEELEIQSFSCARKPNSKNFNKIIKMHRLKENEIAIIGDQILTDIVGGNIVGITTVLVTPITLKEPFYTKINRHKENKIMDRLREGNLFKKGRYYD